MTDLDAIRERHRPHRDEDGTFCLADSQDWGEHGCDAVQALARVDEGRAMTQEAHVHRWEPVRIFRDGDSRYIVYPKDWKTGDAVVTLVCVGCQQWQKVKFTQLLDR